MPELNTKVRIFARSVAGCDEMFVMVYRESVREFVVTASDDDLRLNHDDALDLVSWIKDCCVNQ